MDQNPSKQSHRNTDPRYDRVRASLDIFTQRMSLIRALYIVSVATNGPRDEILAEFHQAVGDILEGMALSKLELTLIDKDRVSEEAAWLHERK